MGPLLLSCSSHYLVPKIEGIQEPVSIIAVVWKFKVIDGVGLLWEKGNAGFVDK